MRSGALIPISPARRDQHHDPRRRALSLRAAAELAGVSHAAPYRHFHDRDALVAAIAEEGFRLLTRMMRDEIAATRGQDLGPRLRAAGRGYVAFALGHSAYFRTIFGGATWDTAEAAGLRAAGDEAYQVLRGLIAEGITNGELRAGDPDQVSLAAWSLVHGLSMLKIDGALPGVMDEPEQVRGVTDALVQMLATGLAAPARNRSGRPAREPG